MGVWGEQLGGKPDAFPKLGSERAFLASTGHSFHPAAPRAEPQSPDLCWPWAQGDGAGPRGLSSAREGASAPSRGSLATELWTPGNAPSPIPSPQGSADPSGMSLTVLASHDILSQQHCPPSLRNEDSLPTPQLLAVGTIPGAVLLHHRSSRNHSRESCSPLAELLTGPILPCQCSPQVPLPAAPLPQVCPPQVCPPGVSPHTASPSAHSRRHSSPPAPLPTGAVPRSAFPGKRRPPWRRCLQVRLPQGAASLRCRVLCRCRLQVLPPPAAAFPQAAPLRWSHFLQVPCFTALLPPDTTSLRSCFLQAPVLWSPPSSDTLRKAGGIVQPNIPCSYTPLLSYPILSFCL